MNKNTCNKKFLLIFPPLWSFLSPHMALPSLAAQLKNNGFNVNVLDLNIEFFNFILTKDYLEKCILNAEKQYSELLQNKNLFEKNDTKENQILNYKYNELKKFFEENPNKKNLADNISKAIYILRDSRLFYNYKLLLKAEYIINKAINISSLPFLPSVIGHKFNYENKFMRFYLNDIKEVIFDKQQNMFLDFYKTKIESIINDDYSYIGISIGADSQLIGGLTIANILKNETNAHINIGGGFFSRTIEALKQNPDFFDIFAHSVSYNEGENSIVKLAEYINKKIPIEKVPNIIYKNQDKIIINPTGEAVIISRIYHPDYSDYDLKKYFSPEPVLPLQTNRGCYWNKCTFCDHSYGVTYTVKKIEGLINEIKENIEKYNVRYYNIIDEAMHPDFLDRFADALIKNKLQIRFKICARFEKGFSYQLLKKAHKAGLSFIQWGFETGNKRIHILINKGVDFKKRINILKNANKAGIVNFVFAFFAFPSETFNEAMDTISFLEKNNKYIQVPALGCYCLLPESTIMKNPSKFGISISEKNEPFSCTREYTSTSGMSLNEKNKIRKKYNDVLKKYYSNCIFFNLFFSENEQILLYNSKYNLKLLKKMKLKNT